MKFHFLIGLSRQPAYLVNRPASAWPGRQIGRQHALASQLSPEWRKRGPCWLGRQDLEHRTCARASATAQIHTKGLNESFALSGMRLHELTHESAKKAVDAAGHASWIAKGMQGLHGTSLGVHSEGCNQKKVFRHQGLSPATRAQMSSFAGLSCF